MMDVSVLFNDSGHCTGSGISDKQIFFPVPYLILNTEQKGFDYGKKLTRFGDRHWSVGYV